jgi:hypothetical protein
VFQVERDQAKFQPYVERAALLQEAAKLREQLRATQLSAFKGEAKSRRQVIACLACIAISSACRPTFQTQGDIDKLTGRFKPSQPSAAAIVARKHAICYVCIGNKGVRSTTQHSTAQHTAKGIGSTNMHVHSHVYLWSTCIGLLHLQSKQLTSLQQPRPSPCEF